MMVSIGNSSANASRGSGFSFSEEIIQNQDEEVLIHPGSISSDVDGSTSFRSLKTVWVSSLLLLLLIAVEAVVFVLPLYCYSGPCFDVLEIDGLSALVFLQTGFWSLLVLIDQYLRLEHRKVRKAGYLNFYQKTRLLGRISLYLYSVGNALLLILLVIFQNYCVDKRACRPLKPINYVQLVISIENLIAFPLIIIYLVHVVDFNNKRPSPDIIRDDLLSSYSQIRVPTLEIGYRDEDVVEDVIEKQADVIRYLKQHNATLGKKLVEMTSQLCTNQLA